MKSTRAFRYYRSRLKKLMPESQKVIGKAKHLNLKVLKVCFGPCRCFSAAKR